ncbi:MAG: hypothetical protein WDN46_14370 [Methylocella sp.]
MTRLVVKVLLFAMLALAPAAAHAQMRAFVVTSCADLPAIYNPGSQGIPVIDETGAACTGGGGGGGFTPNLGNQTKPNAQATTPATGATITMTKTTVGTTVVSIAPLSTAMVHRVVKNCSPNTSTPPAAPSPILTVGPSATTTATGFDLAPGESLDVSTLTAQVFGISNVAGTVACYFAN